MAGSGRRRGRQRPAAPLQRDDGPLWRDTSVARRLLAAAVVIDPLWALSSRRAGQAGTARERRLFYAGAGGTLVVVWPVAIGVGALLGGSSLASGWATASLLQMCLPVSLAAVVGPWLRTSAGARAVLAAAVVGWLGHTWPSGTGLLAAMAAAAGSRPRSREGKG